MQLDIMTLGQYRSDRAKEDLLAAETNHRAGLYKAAINCSYYAIFHSMRAVNVLDNFDASKHSSVIAHFNQFYIHKGEFERGMYKIIGSAYRIREKCDYSDFFIASKADSEIQLKRAYDFVNAVEDYLNHKFNNVNQ